MAVVLVWRVILEFAVTEVNIIKVNKPAHTNAHIRTIIP